MATPYSAIYDKFVTLFKDDALANLTQPTLESLFENWLEESASVKFKECRQDLNDRNDTLKQFNIDLTFEEQWILAYAMQVTWVGSVLYDKDEKFRNRFNDRDFSTFSPALLINSLTEIYKVTECKFKDAKNSYIKDGITFSFM